MSPYLTLPLRTLAQAKSARLFRHTLRQLAASPQDRLRQLATLRPIDFSRKEEYKATAFPVEKEAGPEPM